jgi:hypothetical protein
MQNTITETHASATQAPVTRENEINSANPVFATRKTLHITGHGARELTELAQRYGHARARRFLALSGADIPGDDLAEIYHARFAEAATLTGTTVPDWDADAWRVALEDATRETDAHHYAHKRDGWRLMSVDASSGDEEERGATVDDSAAFQQWSARTCRRGSLRRLVRHARECLIAHWALSGSSSRWQSALRDDLARLATLARVARSGSFSEFGTYADFNSSAARKAFQRLAQRMASGDALLTDKPEESENALCAWQSRRTGNFAALHVVSSVS